eukprot:2364195-Prymnesium_polylepis.1
MESSCITHPASRTPSTRVLPCARSSRGRRHPQARGPPCAPRWSNSVATAAAAGPAMCAPVAGSVVACGGLRAAAAARSTTSFALGSTAFRHGCPPDFRPL